MRNLQRNQMQTQTPFQIHRNLLKRNFITRTTQQRLYPQNHTIHQHLSQCQMLSLFPSTTHHTPSLTQIQRYHTEQHTPQPSPTYIINTTSQNTQQQLLQQQPQPTRQQLQQQPLPPQQQLTQQQLQHTQQQPPIQQLLPQQQQQLGTSQ